MPTNAENLATALASLTTRITEVLANPLPNITVDGVSIDRMGYYRSLLELQKALIQQAQMVAGPFEVVSAAR